MIGYNMISKERDEVLMRIFIRVSRKLIHFRKMSCRRRFQYLCCS